MLLSPVKCAVKPCSLIHINFVHFWLHIGANWLSTYVLCHSAGTVHLVALSKEEIILSKTRHRKVGFSWRLVEVYCWQRVNRGWEIKIDEDNVHSFIFLWASRKCATYVCSVLRGTSQCTSVKRGGEKSWMMTEYWHNTNLSKTRRLFIGSRYSMQFEALRKTEFLPPGGTEFWIFESSRQESLQMLVYLLLWEILNKK